MMRHIVLLAAFTVLAHVVPAQRGADLLGWDAQTGARAGVDVAIAETISALVTNPAGLTRIDSEWRIDLTARAFVPTFDYADPLNPGGVSYDEVIPAPYFGVAWDPDPGDAGRAGDLRLAAGLYHVSGFRNELDIVTQDFPEPGTSREVDYIYTAFHVGASYRITDDIAVGLTLSLTYSDLDVVEPLELGVEKFQGMSPLGNPWGQLLMQQLGIEKVRIEGTLESEPVFGFQATLGFMWEVTDTFTVAVAYRTPGWQQDYDAEVDVDISRIFGEPDPVTFPDGFAVNYDGRIEDFDYPMSLAIGVAWWPCDEVRLAAEVRWTDWSATHHPLNIALRNGDNPGFNAFVGSDSLEVTDVIDYDDQFVFGMSVEWFFCEGWVARAGFSAQTNPVDREAANPLAPAWSRYHVGIGVGYRGDGWSVDAAWLHTYDETMSVGTSIVSSDLDGSRQRFGADSFFLTVSFFF